MEVEQYTEAIAKQLEKYDDEQVVMMVEGYGLLSLVKATIKITTEYVPSMRDILRASSSRDARRQAAHGIFNKAEAVGRSGPSAIVSGMKGLVEIEVEVKGEGFNGTCNKCEEHIRYTCLGISDASNAVLSDIYRMSSGYMFFAREVLGDKDMEKEHELYDAVIHATYAAAHERCQKEGLFAKHDEEQGDVTRNMLADLLLSGLAEHHD